MNIPAAVIILLSITLILATFFFLVTIPQREKFNKRKGRDKHRRLSPSLLLVATITSMALVLGACSDDPSPVENGVDYEKQIDTQQENKSTDSNNQVVEKEISEKERESPKVSKANKVKGNLEAHFIDVGQGDSTLFMFDGHTILIDAGDWKRDEVVPYLKSKGVKKIDLLIGTHPHADHIGQFPAVLNNFKVNEVWMSGGTTNSKLFKEVLSSIDAVGASYNEPRFGEKYSVGDLKIEVVNPGSLSGHLNNDSIVIRAQYGNTSFMMTGDAETKAENFMASSGANLKSTILKAGHHGSDTSTTPSFLKKVNPEVYIISVGERNSYGHPSQGVINRVKNIGAEVYATSSNGNIIVKTDGNTYDISSSQSGEVKGTKSPRGMSKNTGSTSSRSSSSVSSGSSNVASGSSNSEAKVERASKNTSGSCIDINSASLEELRGIKHIDEVRSQAIVDLRPFESVDELTKVKGIAAKRLQDIKDEGLACVK